MANQRPRRPALDTVSEYLREIGRYSILTREEERELAKKLDACRIALRSEAMPAAERERLDRRLERLTNEMVQANLRLVVHIARGFLKRGIPFQDLVQEGNLGLMRAVETFDYRRKLKFSTYAYHWVRQSIERAIANQSRTVRLPVHVQERWRQIRQANATLTNQLGRRPDTEEVASRLGLSKDKLNETYRAIREQTSLDDTDKYGRAVSDRVADSRTADPEQRDLQDKLRRTLRTIDPRRRGIVLRRFGIGIDRPRTLNEVGETVGLSRERVRQIEKETIRELRRRMTS